MSKDIYKKARESGDQFDTVVTQIAKDMNEAGVSEVLNNLDRYVPKADGGDTSVPQQGVTEGGNAPDSESSSQDLAKILKEQVPEDAIPVGRTKEGDPIFIVVIDGVERRVANVAGSPYLVQ
jgi:hypothetical protein